MPPLDKETATINCKAITKEIGKMLVKKGVFVGEAPIFEEIGATKHGFYSDFARPQSVKTLNYSEKRFN